MTQRPQVSRIIIVNIVKSVKNCQKCQKWSHKKLSRIIINYQKLSKKSKLSKLSAKNGFITSRSQHGLSHLWSVATASGELTLNSIAASLRIVDRETALLACALGTNSKGFLDRIIWRVPSFLFWQ